MPSFQLFRSKAIHWLKIKVESITQGLHVEI